MLCILGYLTEKTAPNTVGVFALWKFFFGLHINIGKGGNSLPKHSERTPKILLNL